jgi:maltose alpha-D-glucosyltransferase/alpha-amylase
MALLVVLSVEYVQGDPEEYLLPLAFAPGEEAERLQRESAQLVVAPLQVQEPGERGLLYDAVADHTFLRALFEAMVRHRTFKSPNGELQVSVTAAFRPIRGDDAPPPQTVLAKSEQSNYSGFDSSWL